MGESSSDAASLGLVYKARVPLCWHERDIAEDESLVRESYVQAEKTLQMLTLTQEHGHEPVEDETERSAELARIEAKVDLMLNMLSSLVLVKAPSLKKQSVQLASQGMLWLAEGDPLPASGKPLWIELYLDAQFPWPLRLPARMLDRLQQDDELWVQLGFEQLPGPLIELLDKLIFRHHRRQVAQLRHRG